MHLGKTLTHVFPYNNSEIGVTQDRFPSTLDPPYLDEQRRSVASPESSISTSPIASAEIRTLLHVRGTVWHASVKIFHPRG